MSDAAADAVLAQIIAAVTARSDALELLERAAEKLSPQGTVSERGPGQPAKPDGAALAELRRLLEAGVPHGTAVHRAARLCVDGCCPKSKHRIARKHREKAGQYR